MDLERGEMSATARPDLRNEIRDGFAENRRHLDKLVAALRDDIRKVAQEIAVISAKLDALNGYSQSG